MCIQIDQIVKNEEIIGFRFIRETKKKLSFTENILCAQIKIKIS